MEIYYYIRKIDANNQPCAVPRTTYEDFASAKKEAERQCSNSPTCRFEILKCVAVTKAEMAVTTILEDNDDDLFQDIPW